VPDTTPPQFQREMRGMWIATVANIDWPSAATLTAEQQKAELLDILTRAAALGTNTIILQVRPAGDAVYQSSIEPWAALLSGTQGTDPGYDPLAFAIDEAHKRGLQLHAWINPFRAGNTADSAKLAATHSFKTRRAIMRVYGTQLWFDPGEPEATDHTLRVLTDIVTRYDVDGLHLDDFFYPYPQASGGQTIAFPDDATFTKFGAGMTRDDWRRSNIDRFVERMYGEMHAIKPQMQVGISPFGIWRPGNPAGVNGLDAYAAIYADSRKWLQQGWVDYLAPQLYWAIAAPSQSFPALLDWWATQSQSSKGRHVWPGLATYRVQDGTSSAFTLQEIPSQIERTRTRLAAAPGHLLYNTSWTLKRNGGAVATSLKPDVYTKPALVPIYSWLDAVAPPAPTISVGSGAVGFTPAEGELPRWWTVRAYAAGKWSSRLLFGGNRATVIDPGTERVLVQVYDQAGNASPVVEWRKP
jgi:uncharacterized lipoprotein YddW (UPF0748 family)